MVSSATMAATTATTGTGARRMSASTIGIRTTAVAMRLSKGSWWGVMAVPVRSLHEPKNFTTEATKESRRVLSPGGFLCPRWLGFYFCRRNLKRRVSLAVVQTAVAALSLLIFRNAFEQVHTAEIRPKRRSHINLGVRELPQQKIAQPHLARGSYHQVRIGKIPRIEVPGHHMLIDLEVIKAAVPRRRVHDGAERVHQFAARAVVQRQRQHHTGVPRRRLARPGHALLYVVGKFVLSPNIFQADIVLVQGGNFRLQIAAQQSHQKVDFAFRALLPVLLGKGVERERRNANA